MNRRSGKLLVAATIALFGVSLGTSAFADFTIKRIVRCDRGMNVQDVLDRNILSLPMEVFLVGTCDGFEIEQDDVEISALHDHACPGATVAGGILLNGTQRIDIRCIAVTAGDEIGGIFLYSSNATIEDVDIWGTNDTGLALGGGSYAEVTNSTIRDNGEGVSIERSNASFEETYVSGNSGFGVIVEHNSSLEFIDGSITGNDSNGIRVTDGSNLVLDGTWMAENGRSAIGLLNGSMGQIASAELVDNGQLGVGGGVFMRRNSTAQILGTNILRNSGNGVAVRGHSFAEIGGGTRIEENGIRGMRLREDSGATLADDTYIPGSGDDGIAIYCDDSESSVLFDPAAVITGLIGPVDCTGFELESD